MRSEVHRKGLRYRVDHPVRVGLPRAVRVDMAFTRVQLAVFVDGCFWHQCPEHGTTPKSNLDYWIPKLAANVARDHRADAAFAASGRVPWSGGSERSPLVKLGAGYAASIAGVTSWLHGAVTGFMDSSEK